MSSALLLEGIEEETTFGYTENGAVTFTSSLNKNLDFFAMASAKRDNPGDAVRLFLGAYQEDPIIAILNLFYCRDVRGGQGERTIFRMCLEQIDNKYLENEEFLKLIPEYGRWDDLIMLLLKFGGREKISQSIVKVIAVQITIDLRSHHPSLCAKWIPLRNCVSNPGKKRVAKTLVNILGMSERNWRKIITPIRQKLNLVETKLTERDYASIEYDKLPSRAFNKYKTAFFRNDEERIQSFLAAVKRGEKKLNTNCIYPYEIISQVRQKLQNGSDPYCRHGSLSPHELETFTEMWKALPEFNTKGNVLSVVDVSGSMFTRISSSSNAQAIDVSTSLGIYTAEHNTGIFKNHYISFSERPQLISLNPNFSIVDKLKYIYTTDMGYNTNIQAVFDCILNAMKLKSVPREECPSIILMISDMEFDSIEVSGYSRRSRYGTNYEEIRRKYLQYGYELPQLVFWNVMSRNDNIPVRKDESGVVLVSGMSPAILRFISEGDINPERFMMNVLNSERYLPVKRVIYQ